MKRGDVIAVLAGVYFLYLFYKRQPGPLQKALIAALIYFAVVALLAPKRYFRLLGLAGAVVFFLITPFFMPKFENAVLTDYAVYVLAAISLNMLIGMTGEISLGHGAFYAIGAYAAAILTLHGMSFWLAFPIAGGIAGAIFVALIVVPWLASFFTDWLWFKEIGFQTVFATSLIWRVVLFFVGGAFAFAYFYGNVRIARGGGTGFPVLYVNRGDGVTVDISRMFKKLFLPDALLLSLLSAISLSAWWLTLLKGINGVPLGARDPLFDRDISFYLFRLPLCEDRCTFI